MKAGRWRFGVAAPFRYDLINQVSFEMRRCASDGGASGNRRQPSRACTEHHGLGKQYRHR